MYTKPKTKGGRIKIPAEKLVKLEIEKQLGINEGQFFEKIKKINKQDRKIQITRARSERRNTTKVDTTIKRTIKKSMNFRCQ